MPNSAYYTLPRKDQPNFRIQLTPEAFCHVDPLTPKAPVIRPTKNTVPFQGECRVMMIIVRQFIMVFSDRHTASSSSRYFRSKYGIIFHEDLPHRLMLFFAALLLARSGSLPGQHMAVYKTGHHRNKTSSDLSLGVYPTPRSLGSAMSS
jgi:hypothetical protein